MKKLSGRSKVVIALSVLVIGLLANVASSSYIYYAFNSGNEYTDILLDGIDGDYVYPMLMIEVLIAINILFFGYFLLKNKSYFFLSLLVIGLFQLVRAFLLPLTLMDDLQSYSFFRSFKSFSFGLFPSGHVGVSYLFFLLTYRKSWLWILFLVSTLLTAVALIVSKQHYTIDVVASVFIGYSIKAFVEKRVSSG